MARWNDEEKQIVYNLLEEDKSSDEISEILKKKGYKRTPASVRGLYLRNQLEHNKKVNNENVLGVAKLNPYKLKKAELLELMTKKCKHRHYYMQHPACWFKERGKEPKAGYIDIETSNLKANFGMILSYVIKTRDKDEYFQGLIKRKDILAKKFDKKVVEKLVTDMSRYDVLLGYWSTGFDLPFIRSRALYHNIPFPAYGHIKHKDVYYMVRNKLCLHRNSLESACNFLGIEGKNHVIGNHWMLAQTGDKEALEYVLDHNIRDVEILEELHKKIEIFVKTANKSI